MMGFKKNFILCKGHKENFRTMKIVLITNIPNPYRIPLFNSLNSTLNKKGIDLIVLFGAKGYARRKWVINTEDCLFPYQILKSVSFNIGKKSRTIFTYAGLIKIILNLKPDLVITSGFSLNTLITAFLSFKYSVPYIIWTGTNNTKGRSETYLKLLYKRFISARAAHFISYGTKTKSYIVDQLHISESKISIAINTVDTNYFRERTKQIKEKDKAINKPHVLLYLGYLTKKKRIDLLLDALRKNKMLRSDFILKIVGDGPERSRLEDLVDKYGLIDNVSFEGFKQKYEIPNYFAEATCLLFPSEYDIWGLVIVEAMAAGVPCLSSIHCGVTDDLIIDGETGFAIDFEQTDKVVEIINYLINDPKLARVIGNNAARLIEAKCSLENSVKGFVDAITLVNDINLK
jgi:glycosyltransferase involved in cell wall biosynthesis